ncbi:SpoIIE family protein phosphatase [Streptomyces lunaelactis]|uniref:SpoIIE family protein phosphatase n=1 Tax=Streptomyces lunaelactis TaxID=1535768 RepID=UPI0015847E4E|nr:SpoIIE family protein phosphatase [Streptomyces lunaelactis]NUK06468.1 SpoIIE family protein phosphatase [Streptomyces lunaelactis]NUL08197.1 SpoIIE family protein phosphatase [Streptomyces lunaelactis]NUL24017.1 SpoIIE family protein phosphatase [Streptomyces lunaelactis]
MGATEPSRGDLDAAVAAPSGPGGLLDVLNVAAVLLDAEGRIDLWSPQAEDLFGYSAEEALGQYAARLLVSEEALEQVLTLFAQVMEGGGSWAGVFPVRHKDGSTRLVEFRNMRLQDDQRDYYALGLAADRTTLRQVERDLALSARLVSQSPIGLGVLDTDLRYVSVNPAEERMNGVPAVEHIGRHVHEVLPFLDESFEAAMREVLATGTPVLDQYTVGRTPADPDNDHAWSISFYRLEAPNGNVLGVATSSVDVTERHRAVEEQRHTALTLQRSLLPHPPPRRPGLEVATRYRPAQATIEIGGDWFDVIPLSGDKTALVVGDVMGSGVGAAATMGQLRTATRTLADLDLDPAQVMHHLDHVTDGLDTLATCVYAVYDPRTAQCRVSLAGHLPPVLHHPDGTRELLDLPTGAPLGGCGVAFHTTCLDIEPRAQLVLYTDGLVETRDQPIDTRLEALLDVLDDPNRSLDDTCDLLLHTLRHPGDHDDVALLIARAGELLVVGDQCGA